MKGVIFTEFVEFVEERYGFDTADEILVDEKGEDRIFTQAGNYPFDDLVAVITTLCKVENIELKEVLYYFGEYLFERLAKMASFLIEGSTSSFDLISKVDSYIHIEVKKLYPDADLPKFRVRSQSDTVLEMEYQSEKRLEELGKGLMSGCAKFFNENVDITYHIESENPHTSIFRIEKL